MFRTQCIRGSLFTSYHPGGWFDVGGHGSSLGWVEMANQGTATFSPNITECCREQYGYVNSEGKEISVFWFQFGDIIVATDDMLLSHKEIEVYPNPFSSELKVADRIEKVVRSSIFDVQGKKRSSWAHKNFKNLSSLEEGMYFLIVELENKQKQIHKVVKMN